MAWIKMRTCLWDDPRISRMCDITDQQEATVIGALYWLWAMADMHTENGNLPGLTTSTIDRKTGIKGIADALLDVGWITQNEDGITITNFEDHNGQSAKKRAQTAKRVASHKANNQSVAKTVTQPNGTANATLTPEALPREDKIREDNTKHTTQIEECGVGISDKERTIGYLALEQKINALCSHWDSPKEWTANERRALSSGNAKDMEDCPDDQWQTLKLFLNSNPENDGYGAKYFRVDTRQGLATAWPSVLQSARKWGKVTGKGIKPSTKPQPKQTSDTIWK